MSSLISGFPTARLCRAYTDNSCRPIQRMSDRNSQFEMQDQAARKNRYLYISYEAADAKAWTLQRTRSPNNRPQIEDFVAITSVLWRFVSEHQNNFRKSSLRRISPQVPCCSRHRRQLAFISARLGAACKGLRVSTAIRAGSTRT